MNWLKRTLKFGEKIKKILKKRPSREEMENSDWTSCCKGPVLKKDLEENFWVCNSCGKHHRISCRQRFDYFFGINNYEVLETPSPIEDPLNMISPKLIGARISDENNEYIGQLISMISHPGHDIYVVLANNKELLIPVVPEIIKNINHTNKEIIISNMSGLLN